MDFIQKIQDAKTIVDLFGLRDFFVAYQQSESDHWLATINDPAQNKIHLQNSYDAKFYIDRVEAQIKYLESRGVFIAQIEVLSNEATKETTKGLEKC